MISQLFPVHDVFKGQMLHWRAGNDQVVVVGAPDTFVRTESYVAAGKEKDYS